MKPFVVPRRFTIEQDSTGTYMVFGHGSDSEADIQINVADPSSAALKLTGRNYITDRAFDPTKLLDTNKLGVAPQNTTLTIVYGANDADDINVPTNSVNSVKDLLIEFPDDSRILPSTRATVIDSIEVTNDQRIIGNTPTPSADEIKIRSYRAYSSQNRAVTREDYEAHVYLMPPKFGSIKRAAVINDPSSSNRRLSLYLTSLDNDGNLTLANDTLKQNVKTWLNTNKMLNDSIDIYDPYIINIGFTFYISVESSYDKQVVLNDCFNALNRMFSEKMYIGEPLYVSKIYRELNKLDGVIDVQNVIFNVKNSANYASSPISLQELMSNDGTYLKTPKNAILEVKFANLDIKGVAR